MGSKALTEETMRPVLEKLREHLIAKNVAAEIANKLCDSVAAKLEGKVIIVCPIYNIVFITLVFKQWYAMRSNSLLTS